MPLIDAFCGIKIYIYGREHRPPHIHAYYGEYEIIINIKTEKIIIGRMSTNKEKEVLDWLHENSERALHIFYKLNSKLR